MTWQIKALLALCVLSVSSCSAKQGTELGLSTHAMQALRDEGYDEELARARVISKLVDSSFTYRVDLDGKLITVIKNVTNHDFRSGNSDQSTRVVVEEVETILGTWENNHSLLRAKCIEVDKDGDQEQLWSFEEEADSGEEWGRDYRTVENGCCGDSPLYRLHRMTDGKNYLTYDMDLFNFSVRGESGEEKRLDRRIASRCMFSASEPWPANDSLSLGAVYYATEDSILHTLVVASRDSTIRNLFYWWPYEIRVVSIDTALTLAREYPDSCRVSLSDPAVSSVEIEKAVLLGKFGKGPVLIVPIKDDDFLIENSRFKDFEIIRVN